MSNGYKLKVKTHISLKRLSFLKSLAEGGAVYKFKHFMTSCKFKVLMQLTSLSASYRNQSINLYCKVNDGFLIGEHGC